MQRTIVILAPFGLRPKATLSRRALPLAALEHPAGEVLFFDDKLRNITAAQALGIPSIHYTGAPALLAELRRRDLITPDEHAELRAIG